LVGRTRPLAAVRDFLIERPVSSSHRPFAGVTLKFDRRRKQSPARTPGKVPIHRQLPRSATARPRPSETSKALKTGSSEGSLKRALYAQALRRAKEASKEGAAEKQDAGIRRDPN
jgi:hypothetical protein